MKVCVVVSTPAVECPISFSFDVRIFTVLDTAGSFS